MYHSEQLFTLCTVFKTADGGSSRLIRIFDKSGVSVVIVIGVIPFFLRFGFGLCLQFRLSRFREPSLLRFRRSFWFVKFLRIVPISGLLWWLTDKELTAKIELTSALRAAPTSTCASVRLVLAAGRLAVLARRATVAGVIPVSWTNSGGRTWRVADNLREENR